MVLIMKALLVIVLLLLATTVLGLYRGWPPISAGNTKGAIATRVNKAREDLAFPAQPRIDSVVESRHDLAAILLRKLSDG